MGKRRVRSQKNSTQRLPERTDGKQPTARNIVLLGCAAIVLSVLVLYAPVRHFQFVSWDDPEYVTDNPQVRAGLTASSIRWAFTSGHAANWHPLTWMSHMLDVDLYGMNPGAHHVTNVALHLAAALLLFWFFVAHTGHTGRSVFVALAFAIHPAHVESVAWIAERKDVLCGFFFALTLVAYGLYAAKPSMGRFMFVFTSMAAGLMAKPMLVTLPFVLLLLDIWPLHRLRSENAARTLPDLVWEKLPLFGLSVASSIVTFLVQQSGGAVAKLDMLPPYARIGNAILSYGRYMGELLWPVSLSVVYPFEESLPIVGVVALAVLLIVVTYAAIRYIFKAPYFAAGWLWYLGMLVPVIGIVQVGSQPLADRYTYLPSIGIFLALAWGFGSVASRLHLPKHATSAIAVAALAACALVTSRQVQVWTSNLSLWGHAIEVTKGNYQAHASYANALTDAGSLGPAIEHYREALRIRPSFALARTNLANALARQGKPAEAVEHYAIALKANPDDAIARVGYGSALDDLGRVDEAVVQYQAAIRADPDFAEAYNDLAAAYVKQGRLADAIAQMRTAVDARPYVPVYHLNLAKLYENNGMREEAKKEYEAAGRVDAAKQR